MKDAFIQRQRSRWPVSVMCEVLGVSPGGYHQHFTRKAQCGERSRLSDDALLVHIKVIHAESKGSYGWPRAWTALLARGIRVGKDRGASSCSSTASRHAASELQGDHQQPTQFSGDPKFAGA